MTRSILISVLVLIPIVTVWAGETKPASACLNAVSNLHEYTRKVNQAETMLQRGRAAVALGMIARVLRDHRRGRIESGMVDPFADPSEPTNVQGLIARAEEVRASSVIRLEGGVNLTRTRARRTSDANRRKHLEWAVATLEERPEQPAILVTIAEAQLLLGQAEEAAAQLRSLHEEDLLPNARAYRLLAWAEQLAENQDAMNTALATCRERAGRQARRICNLRNARILEGRSEQSPVPQS